VAERDLERRLGAVEERLRAAEDRLAIIELEGAYARAYDDHDGDAWAALFTPDGIYQSRPTADGADTFVQGTEALRRFCTEAPFAGIHFLHLPQVTLTGDRATARIHLEFQAAHEGTGAPRTRMGGYYDVAYARHGDRWLIVRRVTTGFARESRTAVGYLPGSGLDG
jgi:uncharacterized protein (TIGR02246 family)